MRRKCRVWSVKCGVGNCENCSTMKGSASIVKTRSNSTLHTPHFTLFLCCALLFMFGCKKNDPILPGDRVPVFYTAAFEISDKRIDDLGQALEVQPCGFTIDGNNIIWQGERRIFAGLPTEFQIHGNKQVVCNGMYLYAGLSTGELVKINSETRQVEWVSDIFQPNAPTGITPFFDIVAAPVVSGDFVFAGGLGGAFCRIRDRDGKRMWCLPMAVQDIIHSSKTFHVVKTTDGEVFAVSIDGKVFGDCDKCIRK